MGQLPPHSRHRSTHRARTRALVRRPSRAALLLARRSPVLVLLPIARRAPWHPVASNTRRRSTGSIRQQARFLAVEGQGRELDSGRRDRARSWWASYFIGGASSGKPVRLEPWIRVRARRRGFARGCGGRPRPRSQRRCATKTSASASCYSRDVASSSLVPCATRSSGHGRRPSSPATAVPAASRARSLGQAHQHPRRAMPHPARHFPCPCCRPSAASPELCHRSPPARHCMSPSAHAVVHVHVHVPSFMPSPSAHSLVPTLHVATASTEQRAELPAGVLQP